GPARWISEEISYKLLDGRIIDGFINGTGKVGLAVGRFIRNQIDLPVWNRFLEWTSARVPAFGRALKPLQTGRVQQYMVVAITIVVLVGVLFYYFFVMA